MAQEQEHSKIRFFEPYVGKKYYEEGVNGKKVLVLGASFYCEKGEINSECHSICTNPNKRATADFKDKCPYCKRYNKNLTERAEIAINIEKCDSVSYQNFEIFLQAILLKEHPWDYVAFTNYVQFMVPTQETKKEYLSDIDYESFEEVIEYLKPDVVIEWGKPVQEHLETKISEIKEELKKSDGYICNHIFKGVSVTIVCLRHPSKEGWSEVLRHSYKYVKQALI